MNRLLAAWVAVMGVVVAAQADSAATVRAVRQITAPATTRLIVELSEPVHYRLQRAAARPELGVPARLYVDLLNTRFTDAALAGVTLDQGPLLRLRGSQRDATSTRLILDVPGLTEYGAFSMPDPFRLIIDVRGAARAGTPRPTPHADAVMANVPSALAHPPATRAPEHRRAKVVIDPGHGGKDPGAIGIGGVAEKDVVLAIAERLKAGLLAAGGIDVMLTRDTDVFLALEERTARANAEQADLFVSIHANASPNAQLSGVETYYLNNTNDRATIRLAEMENGLRSMLGRSKPDRQAALIISDLIQSYKIQESAALAEQIQQALVSGLDAQGTPSNNLGVKRGPFYVLVGAGMPCVLVEVAFLTNPQEGAHLAQPRYQDTVAAGLLRGIGRFVENARVAGNL